MGLAVRTDVVEYGAVPTAPWLGHLETAEAMQSVLQRLLELATSGQHGECLVSAEAIGSILDITQQQAKVLLEVMVGAAKLGDHEVLCSEGGDVAAVQPHCLALFLAMHHYLREAQRADTADVWPAEYGACSSGAAQHEMPSSPMRMMARSLGREQVQHHRSYLPAMRQQLQEHLRLQETLAAGLAGYAARHAVLLLRLASMRERPPGAMGSGSGAGGGGGDTITRQEFDRLHVLLRASEGGGAGSARRPDEVGSPMDVCGTPFRDAARRVSDYTPFFPDGGPPEVALAPVAAWLAQCLQSADATPGAATFGSQRPTALRKSPPPLGTPERTLAVPEQEQESTSESVCGVHRATVVKGESDLPPLGTLRVADCHGAVVYALGPLRSTLITCCRDCVVVLGAVGALLRLERCERVQVVAAARRAVVNTCHDCILYLGCPQQPLLLGDNRFVQLAPYNAGYERLAEHCGVAGVRTGTSMWDRPLCLVPGHTRPGSGGGEAGGLSPMQVSQPRVGHEPLGGGVEGVPPGVSLLPPDKLMPFAVPFRGGPGPLCGGPATGSMAPVDTLSSLVDLGAGEGTHAGQFPPSPFPLPPAYAAAWDAKIRGVASVRAAVKSAGLEEGSKRDLMAAIQAQFKDWLQATGAMRHVYDLARLERDEGGGTPLAGAGAGSGSGSGSGSGGPGVISL